MVRETPSQHRARLADSYRRALEELSAAIDAHDLGLQTTAAVVLLQTAVDARCRAWWAAVGVEWSRDGSE